MTEILTVDAEAMYAADMALAKSMDEVRAEFRATYGRDLDLSIDRIILTGHPWAAPTEEDKRGLAEAALQQTLLHDHGQAIIEDFERETKGMDWEQYLRYCEDKKINVDLRYMNMSPNLAVQPGSVMAGLMSLEADLESGKIVADSPPPALQVVAIPDKLEEVLATCYSPVKAMENVQKTTIYEYNVRTADCQHKCPHCQTEFAESNWVRKLALNVTIGCVTTLDREDEAVLYIAQAMDRLNRQELLKSMLCPLSRIRLCARPQFPGEERWVYFVMMSVPAERLREAAALSEYVMIEEGKLAPELP